MLDSHSRPSVLLGKGQAETTPHSAAGAGGLRDVQTTWECFDELAQRFATFGLEETGLYDLYSEASLGKAYLKTMNVKPWRQVQPDFPPKLIGHILSSYYGGRAEEPFVGGTHARANQSASRYKGVFAFTSAAQAPLEGEHFGAIDGACGGFTT
jgi:hypothetical protein